MKTSLHLTGPRLIAAAFLALLTSAKADDGALRKQLLGTWEGAVVTDERTGARRATIESLTITMEEITATDGDGRDLGKGTYVLGEEGGFLTIDATGIAGPAGGQTMLGIWKVEGGTLRWCSGNNGHTRPEEFITRGSGPYLMILTRKKN
jgi:uncharacterized protein (TIGR03067 family)